MTANECRECQIKQVQINRLTRKIMAARRLANQIIDQASEALSHHQPRGTWAYHRARIRTASIIKAKLE